MRQETGMGVLPQGGGGGAKRNIFLKIVSVIMLKSYLISRFKCHICRQPCFLYKKVYSELDQTTSQIMIKHFHKGGGGGGGGGAF